MSDTYGQVSTSITRQDPQIEKYRKALLQDVRDFIAGQITAPQLPPAYQIAGLGQQELDAMSLANLGVGAYAPFLQGALGAVTAGQGAVGSGIGALSDAFNAAGAGQTFINQASQLAGATRDIPYAYQAAASQGLTDATQLGTAYGTQAAQQTQDAAALAQQLGITQQEALNMLGTAMAQQGGLSAADIRAAGQGGAGTTAEAIAGLGEGVGQARYQAGLGQGGAQAAIDAARGQVAGAQELLAGTTGEFDPRGIGAFMGQYDDVAVQQALRDITQAADPQRQQLAAQAVGAGAFGGSRQAVAEQQLEKNVLEQQGRTAAQMRQAGFVDAANRAQQAFEAAQGRGQTAAQAMGNLGLTAEQLAATTGLGMGNLGLSAEQLAARNYAQGAQLGQGQAQLGLSGATGAANAAMQGLTGQLGATQAGGAAGMQGAMAGMQGAQQLGNLGQMLGQLGQAGAQAQGQLGVQYGQLGQQDIAQLLQMGASQGQLGQGLGSLASQYGQMGGQLGQLGIQQAGLGELTQQLGRGDISTLLNLGALERGVRQSGLDAQRLTQTAYQAQPYQQYGFLSDIYMGVPTSQQTTTVGSAPQVSPFQTALGLGIQGLAAASGAQKAGLF